MGKKKGETNVGKGKVTPIQVAFIVDRYLADNNYPQTRFAFRSEASSLLAKSSLHEAPKTLLSLGAMLDEYIRLKEHKLILDREKVQLQQEKLRVQTLLQGMQDVMNAYNSGTSTTTNQPGFLPSSSAGFPVHRSPLIASASTTQCVKLDHTNFSTPVISSCPRRKRKNYRDLPGAPEATKKSCALLPNNQLANKGSNSAVPSNNGSNDAAKSSPPHISQGELPIQGSTVAKNLFNKLSRSPVSNSSGPKTPPRAASSQSDKSISPLEEVSSTAMSELNSTPLETTPTNCTIFSSKTIIVSPSKQFSIERNHCSFSSPSKAANLKKQTRRDHVKSRLDFDSSDVPTGLDNASGDGSSTSESEKEGDLFDLDLPSLDEFGPDFSLEALLTDFGIDCGALDYSGQATAGTSADAVPEPLFEAKNGNLGTSQSSLEHSSTVTEVFSEDANKNGADSITSVKSVTKCIRIVSPTKSSRNSSISG